MLAGICVASANAKIVVQHGIAGVTVGMSKAKARSVLGTPKKVIHARNLVGPYVRYQYPGLSLDFQNGGPLSNVFTTRKSERTASGAGVGTTRAQLMQKVPGIHCSPGLCSVGKSTPGKIVTTFYMLRGAVVAVSVGRVID